MSAPADHQASASSAQEHMLFVARGTAVGIVGRLAARLLLLVLSPVVARIMGASGLGLIGLGITTLLVGSTIASMGIPTGIVR